jgi:transposase
MGAIVARQDNFHKTTQQWREGKLLLPSSDNPQLLPVTLDAAAVQPEPHVEAPEALNISCEVTFLHGTLRLNGTVSEKLLTLLIQELKR